MLSRQHIKLLKKIKKNKVVRNTYPNKDLDYLREEGYIETILCNDPVDFYAEPYLTEKGKAKLDEQRKTLVSFWVPVIISLVSLFKSFLPELFWLLQELMQLLK